MYVVANTAFAVMPRAGFIASQMEGSTDIEISPFYVVCVCVGGGGGGERVREIRR